MGNTSSGEEGSSLASPNILSKVTVKGSKADMDAFLTEGRVNNVQIGYVTKKQVCIAFLACVFAAVRATVQAPTLGPLLAISARMIPSRSSPFLVRMARRLVSIHARAPSASMFHETWLGAKKTKSVCSFFPISTYP